MKQTKHKLTLSFTVEYNHMNAMTVSLNKQSIYQLYLNLRVYVRVSEWTVCLPALSTRQLQRNSAGLCGAIYGDRKRMFMCHNGN